MTKARTVANFGAVTSDATELNLLDGETDLATQTELNDKLAISTATSTYAPLASPIFTGAPVTPILKLTPIATASAPAGVEGALYYDSDEESLMQHDGTEWSRIYIPPPEGSGGTEATYSGYKAHIFTGDGTFTITNSNLTLDILLIAGGGSGAADGATNQGNGGGGAGGMYVIPGLIKAPGAYAIVVGDGGAGGMSQGGSGEDTTGFGFTANGGGRGGYYSNSAGLGGTGYGSGGGGGYSSGGGGAHNNHNDGTNYHYGYDGGEGSGQGGGGGGGAGAGVGGTRDAGVGRANDYITTALATTHSVGEVSGGSVYYSGGGGGGKISYYGTGGTGGGGQGNGDSGTDYTGGGGASGMGGTPGGSGGSGVVIIRYAA